MTLTRLVYYSQPNPSERLNVDDLIVSCRRNNARAFITGMLHYNGDRFLQVLEGGRAEVSAIYHRIARDPRHTNLILISSQDARERMFPTWSMGVHQGMDEAARAIFLRYFPTDEVNPEAVNVDSLLDALKALAVELG